MYIYIYIYREREREREREKEITIMYDYDIVLTFPRCSPGSSVFVNRFFISPSVLRSLHVYVYSNHVFTSPRHGRRDPVREDHGAQG